MISQDKFIEEVKGKKVKQQFRFVQLLRFLNGLFPVKLSCDKAKEQNYLYLTICRKTDFDMVSASLYSLFRNSAIVPNKVVIVSDGTWNTEEGVDYFYKHGLDAECVAWETCASFYKESCPALLKWAQRHIWGKKMAAILYFSENNKVLFSDPDILWYGTPVIAEELTTLKYKVSVDNSHNYDDEFIKTNGFERLYDTEEPINCGAVFISGGLSLLSNDALQCIAYEGDHCGKFAEQTVFAIMDLDFNSRWPMKEITSEISDLTNSFFSKTIRYDGMIARHYLWRLKWIYWREFLNMRLHNKR